MEDMVLENILPSVQDKSVQHFYMVVVFGLCPMERRFDARVFW